MIRTRPRRREWDLLVLGGGTAGLIAARTAAHLGASTLLVERDRTGGDGLWTGCVPSKALIAAAAVAAQTRGAARFGVHAGPVQVDFARAMAHVHQSIAHIAVVDSVAGLEADGVEVLNGEARFVGPTAVRVDDREIPFRQAVLATGATPAVPPIPGLAEAGYLTSDTVWNLDQPPRRLALLGGGSIGCELGQAFARLGTEVTIVEGAARILSREDPAACALVVAALRREGVTVLTGHGVTRVQATQDGHGRLVLDDNSTVPYDRLLVAAGRSPRTRSIGLESAGVDVDGRGFVVVDDQLRTSNPRVWAAGDLTGHPQLTHTAGVHGGLAAANAVLGLRRPLSLTAMPRVTFTHPEIAAVGVPTDPLPQGLRLLHWSHSHVDRAVCEGEPDGFTRLVVDRRGRVLGATVVGPRAGETLAELTLAVRHGLRTRDLAASVHPYPTYGDGPWLGAISDVQRRLGATGVRQAITGLIRARRWVRRLR